MLTKVLGEQLFLNRKEKFFYADAVLYHPGRYPELNKGITDLYNNEGFKKIMVPDVFNKFLNENEYLYHKKRLVQSGIQESIILPITGEAKTANDVIKNAMLQLKNTDKKILLAGKTFFMNRFLIIAAAYAREDMLLDVLPLEDERGLNKDNWHLTETGKKRVVNEYNMIARFLNDYQGF